MKLSHKKGTYATVHFLSLLSWFKRLMLLCKTHDIDDGFNKLVTISQNCHILRLVFYTIFMWKLSSMLHAIKIESLLVHGVSTRIRIVLSFYVFGVEEKFKFETDIVFSKFFD